MVFAFIDNTTFWLLSGQFRPDNILLGKQVNQGCAVKQRDISRQSVNALASHHEAALIRQKEDQHA